MALYVVAGTDVPADHIRARQRDVASACIQLDLSGERIRCVRARSSSILSAQVTPLRRKGSTTHGCQSYPGALAVAQ